MPQNWKTYKLGEIVTLNYGKGLTAKNRIEGNIPVFSSAGHTGWHNKPLIEEEGIVVGRKGSVGTIFKTGGSFYCIDTAYYILKDENKYDFNYLFYLLQSLGLDKLNYDSAVPGLNRDVAYDQEFLFPELKEQKAIASILSSLDDKIELNLEQNKTLEKMAMALYKHWFVDFGPFQDGVFVDSELGMIPEGWEVKRLDEISHKKAESFKFANIEEVVFVNTGDVQEGRFLHSNIISKVGLPGQAKKAIAKGDILYSEIRPKHKRYAFVNFDASNYVVSTKFMIINPKNNILNKLLYRILTMQSTVDNFNSIAEGRSGTFPQITFDAISEMEVVLPPLNVQQDFQNIVGPMEIMQDSLYWENQTLTQLRDTLLPKLISGEVRVKDVEQTLTEIL
jgi:type I restriction enzyme, S subunit